MEDCFSCKVISTGAFFASSAYLAYGAKFWTDKRVNKRFLYPFSAVLLVAGIGNWIIRGQKEDNNTTTNNNNNNDNNKRAN